MNKAILYIGIDDTDNKDSRGTGYRARKMAGLLESNKLAVVEGITRHQLFVSPEIPYTSQNSSACLVLETDKMEAVKNFCRNFLLEDSADGSDVGLCIAEMSKIDELIIDWGVRAKSEVLTKYNAYLLAQNTNIYLEGLTGTKDGVIGALAAVGLRFSGNDGRFIWVENHDLREISGVYQRQNLVETNIVDQVLSVKNKVLTGEENIFMGDWVRPVLKEFKKTLIVEKSIKKDNYEWQVAGKDYIKSISQ